MGAPARFFAASLSHEGEDCLFWPFARFRDGHACIRKNGRSQYAARLVCEAQHGSSPSNDHEAAHSCGNGHLACINGKHLRWATPKENAADRILHGTVNSGERNGKSKLTAAQVKEVFSRFSSGEPAASIAKDFPFGNPRSIYQITSGKTWNEVTGIPRNPS